MPNTISRYKDIKERRKLNKKQNKKKHWSDIGENIFTTWHKKKPKKLFEVQFHGEKYISENWYFIQCNINKQYTFLCM